MNLPRVTLRSTIDASLCRRRQQRERIRTATVTCWSAGHAPAEAAVIEADVKGARLMLPFTIDSNDRLRVAFRDEMGLYQTRVARVAWAQCLSTGKTVAGVAFDEDLIPALAA